MRHTCEGVGAAGTGGNGRCDGISEAWGAVRFVLIVVFLILAVLAGLFIYGQSLQPQTRIIEQEAIRES